MSDLSFQQAVEQIAEIGGAHCPGLQAIKNAHRKLIATKSRKVWRESVDLDAALAARYPNAERWDYGVGIHRDRAEHAIWVEFHPADSQHINEVLKKLAWLKSWLKSSGRPLQAMTRRYVWVATGGVTVTRDSKRMRKLAEEGLYFAGSRLDVDDL